MLSTDAVVDNEGEALVPLITFRLAIGGLLGTSYSNSRSIFVTGKRWGAKPAPSPLCTLLHSEVVKTHELRHHRTSFPEKLIAPKRCLAVIGSDPGNKFNRAVKTSDVYQTLSLCPA